MSADLVGIPVSLAAALHFSSPDNFFVLARLGTGCQNFQPPYGLVGELSSLDIAALQQMDSAVSILDSEHSFGSVLSADLVSLPVSLAASLHVPPLIDLSVYDSPVFQSDIPLDTSPSSHSANSSVVFLRSSSAAPTPRSLVQRRMLSYLHPLPHPLPSPVASSPAAGYIAHLQAFNAALAAPPTVLPASAHRAGLARSSDVAMAIHLAALPYVRQGVDMLPALAFIVGDSIPPLHSSDDDSMYASDVEMSSSSSPLGSLSPPSSALGSLSPPVAFDAVALIVSSSEISFH